MIRTLKETPARPEYTYTTEEFKALLGIPDNEDVLTVGVSFYKREVVVTTTEAK